MKICRAVLFILLVSSHAVAQSSSSDERFAMIDTDNNGSISHAEFQRASTRFNIRVKFDDVDRDKNGVISRQEALRAIEQRDMAGEVDALMNRLDLDKNGSIDLDEFEKSSIARRSNISFKKFDRDNNGSVSRHEVQFALSALRTEQNQSRAPQPGNVKKDLPLQPAALPRGTPLALLRNQVYDNLPNVDPMRLTLDLFAAEGDGPHPIIVMVHGGGWQRGDKASTNVLMPKSSWLSKRGFLFASTNYRFSPSVMHPEHANDVAQAIAWLIENAATFNGDPERIFLMGHSAGAHIVAAIASDPRHLQRAGLGPDVIKGTIPLDVGVYDLSLRLGRPAPVHAVFTEAFGERSAVDPDPWDEASPITHVRKPGSADRIAPFLLITSSKPDRAFALENTRAFEAALVKAGVPVTVVVEAKTHSECNAHVGIPGDPLTTAIGAFLDRRLAQLARSKPDSPAKAD